MKRKVCQGCEYLDVVDADYQQSIKCMAHDPPRYMFGGFDSKTSVRDDCPMEIANDNRNETIHR